MVFHLIREWSLSLPPNRFYILVTFIGNYIQSEGNVTTSVRSVIYPLQVLIYASNVEVLHALIGIVKVPLLPTVLQLVGRNFNTAVVSNVELVWKYLTLYVLIFVTQVQSGWGAVLIIVSWSVTEIIRYPYYNLHQFNMSPYFLFWLR